ncbi:MAG: hypothetical protein ABR524_05060 [Thermoanaerobaculia bacterium]
MRSSSRAIPLHPLLFTLFPIVSLYARNRSEMMLRDAAAPAAIAVGVFGMLWVLLSLFFRDWSRGGIITTIVTLVVFSWAPLDATLASRSVEPWFTATLLIVVGAALIGLIARSKRSLAPLTRLANVAAGGALVAALFPLVVASSADRSPAPTAGSLSELTEVDRTFERALETDTRPDIYYLIFDQYGSAEVLDSHFGWDNAPFVEWLRSRGFFVADQSVANYPRTVLALAANLNLSYVHRETRKVANSKVDWQALFTLLDDHRLGRFLQSRGYRYIHLGSWWPLTAKSSIADLNLYPHVVVDFGTLLFRNTIIYAFVEAREESYEFRREVWRTEREKLIRLPDLASRSEPSFVFAHFLITHSPYVFTPEGDFISRDAAEAMTREQLYLAQIAWTNRELMRIIATIQERGRTTGRMPVIIVQADEGPYPDRILRDGEGFRDNPEPSFQWRTATAEEFAIKSGIINAIFLPEKDADTLLWPSITPVNTFRVISNAYFGTSFPMLPDQRFVYENEYDRNRFFRMEDGLWVEDAATADP